MTEDTPRDPGKINDPYVNTPGMAPLGELNQAELGKTIAWIGRHLRLLDGGAMLHPSAGMGVLVQAVMVGVDVNWKLLQEIKGLREDLALARGAAPDLLASIRPASRTSPGESPQG